MCREAILVVLRLELWTGTVQLRWVGAPKALVSGVDLAPSQSP